MIDYEGIRKLLEDKIGLARFNSGRSNIISYCPWCESDSRKNHGHLYLECTENPNQMPVFHCFKCEDTNPSKGTLLKLLRFLGVDPKKYISKEILNSKFSERSYSYYKKNVTTTYKHVINEPNFDAYKLKKHYLHSRLGFEYDLNRVPRLVLNIREFIRENNITLGDKERFLEFYERSFVGFVSNYGTTLLLRNIDNNSSYRYIKLPLVENKNFFKDLYSIKWGQTKKGSNTIVLCEGIFDLLVAIDSFELQFLRQNACVWSAILGCGYNNSIASALNESKLTAANVTILSDIDKRETYYYSLIKNPSVIKLEVYWNKHGKDFGKLPISLRKKVYN